MGYKKVVFNRDKLYEQVWEQPMIALAKEVLEAEKEVDPEDEQDRAKAALSELFAEAKGEDTLVVVERIVADIDEIVRLVRFPGWQNTNAGEREVQKDLRAQGDLCKVQGQGSGFV